MATTIKYENGTNVNCFVPSCSNKKIIDGSRLHFFPVPQGNEGLRWKVAVNSNQSQHHRKIGILGRSISPSHLYCCELHFNIETDTIVTIDANGDMECKIKPGIFPSMKPTRSKRLWQILGIDKENTFPEIGYGDITDDLLQPMSDQCDTEDETPNNEFVSIVDMSTLICKRFKDITSSSENHANQDVDELDVKFKPLMPLTIDLMRRKSLYYMGLEQSLFFRLLDIIKSSRSDTTDSLIEMKIMLTLRKHRLNEEFEALGDLFDIDKTTAQQYYAESKNLVSNIYHSLTRSMASPIIEESHDVKNPLWIENQHVVEDDQSSSESEISYKRHANKDSDVDSDDFKDYESDSDDSDVDSDDFTSSDFELDEQESDKKVVKETVKCPLCRRSVGSLDYHMKANHLNPQYLNKTVCGLCFGKFQTHKQLRDHQIKMHNGMSCVCDVCGKKFKKFSVVKEHILKVHSKCKPYLCHLCASRYFSAAKLKIHMQNAHIQNRSHECNLCDKKYLQAEELKIHIRAAHTKERPFQCRFGCGKSFCRSGSRHTHEQMHKAKFRCELCSKVFSFRHNLQTHCKNIHGKIFIDTEKCKIEIIQ